MAELKACLKVYCQPDKNFSVREKGKSRRGLDLESTVDVARRLPFLTSA